MTVAAKNSKILEVQEVEFSYAGASRPTLQNITLSAAPGEIVALLGQNGSGKSTLLAAIEGLIKVQQGTILVEGENLQTLNSKERAKRVSYVPQSSVANSLNVFDTIMLGRKPHMQLSPGPDDNYHVTRAFEEFRLGHVALKPTKNLSGGEFQKVCIARAFVQQSPLMLLDEPANNLDVKNQKEIFDHLRKHVDTHKRAAVCVMHDINQAVQYADKLVFMKAGKIVATGGSEIVTRELIEKIYDVPARIFSEEGQNGVVI